MSRFPFPVVLVLVGLGSFSFPRGDGVAGSYPSFPFFCSESHSCESLYRSPVPVGVSTSLSPSLLFKSL